MHTHLQKKNKYTDQNKYLETKINQQKLQKSKVRKVIKLMLALEDVSTNAARAKSLKGCDGLVVLVEPPCGNGESALFQIRSLWGVRMEGKVSPCENPQIYSVYKCNQEIFI